MTRIIAGTAKGRQLKVPPTGTRPTSDRVRESVFSAVGHILGDWGDVAVLDLFAGSGAMGLEAVSRGASQAVLVDAAANACAVAVSNIDKTGLRARVVQSKVQTWLAAPPPDTFDLVFVDPPYDLSEGDVNEVIEQLAIGSWLANHAIVVVERSQRDDNLRWPPGFDDITRRRFGNTSVSRAVWYVADATD